MATNTWEIQDEVYLNGERIPGRVTLTIDSKRAVRKTRTPGEDVPHLADEGYEGATVNMVVDCFRIEQFDAMLPILRMVTPQQPGALASPLAIVAALTIMANIQNVYCESYNYTSRRDGMMTFNFVLPEWFPAEQKKTTTQGKTPPKSGTPGGNDDIGGWDVPPPDPENVGPDFP